ncbi:MAG TPA: hypothetical protein VFB62_21525 [Polyangiaceae bacterium]|nr:hypothetical protein [Polyangiaceae bacterium]
MSSHKLLLVCAALVLSGACSGDESVTGAPGKAGALNVSQGGPQDIAHFRALVDAGEVPAPDTLDPVGFFAEHAVDLPPADCGHDVCVHPMLSVMPRFNGGNWTMAFVAMNTPLDPATLPRPPLHLVLVVERPRETWQHLSTLADGLAAVVEQMQPDDRLTLVSFDRRAHTTALGVAPDAQMVRNWIQQFYPSETLSGLYDGLAAADRAAQEVAADFDGVHRVLLVTSGHATSGVSDPERIEHLAEGMVRRGVAINVVGFGTEYDARLPSAIGSLGAGSYAYAVDEQDLVEVLGLMGETTLFPLATDFRLQLQPAPGYRIGRIYGARRAWASPAFAVLDLPAVFIGRREGAMDIDGGRRGGGGGLFVELIADPNAGIGVNQPAFQVTASWREVGGDIAYSEDVVNALAPGENPTTALPFFSQADYGKPFMMLNMYLALRATTELYEGGDCARSMGVIDMMAPSVQGWNAYFTDPDIDADNDLLLRLGQNVASHCTARGPVKPISPVDSDLGCALF